MILRILFSESKNYKTEQRGKKILNLLEDSQYLPTCREGIWLLELQWGANKL